MKKVGNLILGIVFILLGLIFGLNAIGITDINIFFKGWWTLIIIIPSLIGIIKDSRKIWNYVWLFIGIIFLLSAQGILDIRKIRKLIFPAILVIIGLIIIFKDTVKTKVNEKVKELNKKEVEEYYATFSGQKISFAEKEFNGASVNAIFGGLDLDLRDAKIEKDEIINATAVFGGIDIIVPKNVNVQIKSNSLFGGVDNKVINSKEERPTLYIKAFCLFGATDIK